jgi:hypothetical protein
MAAASMFQGGSSPHQALIEGCACLLSNSACLLAENVAVDRGPKTRLLTLGHLDNQIRASPTH